MFWRRGTWKGEGKIAKLSVRRKGGGLKKSGKEENEDEHEAADVGVSGGGARLGTSTMRREKKEIISGIERTEKNEWRGVWGRWRTGFLEHGEEVHGQVQVHVRRLLWGRAQDEEGGDG